MEYFKMSRKNEWYRGALRIISVLVLSSCATISGRGEGGETYDSQKNDRTDEVIDQADLSDEAQRALQVLEEFFDADAAVVTIVFTDKETKTPFRITSIDRQLVGDGSPPFDISNLGKISKVETITEITMTGSKCKWIGHSGGEDIYTPKNCNNELE